MLHRPSCRLDEDRPTSGKSSPGCSPSIRRFYPRFGTGTQISYLVGGFRTRTQCQAVGRVSTRVTKRQRKLGLRKMCAHQERGERPQDDAAVRVTKRRTSSVGAGLLVLGFSRALGFHEIFRVLKPISSLWQIEGVSIVGDHEARTLSQNEESIDLDLWMHDPEFSLWTQEKDK